MPKYVVSIPIKSWWNYDIEASNEDEAREKAQIAFEENTDGYTIEYNFDDVPKPSEYFVDSNE